MAYEDRFGVTKIRTGQRDQLSISYDYCTVGAEADEKMKRYPMFLYVPDPEESDHSHIGITTEQAVMIRDWFVAYCDDPERLPLE